MTTRDLIVGVWWRWFATTTRTHLVLVHSHADGVAHISGDAEQPGRLLTLCRLGPFETTELRPVDATSPPECRWCMRLWMVELRRLDQEAPVTLGEVAALWPTLVARVQAGSGPVRASLVRPGHPVAVDGHRITVALPADQPFYLERLTRDENLTATVAEIAGELLGVPVTVRWVAGSETSP